VRMQLPVSPSL